MCLSFSGAFEKFVNEMPVGPGSAAVGAFSPIGAVPG
jgi:hypothetical protein